MCRASTLFGMRRQCWTLQVGGRHRFNCSSILQIQVQDLLLFLLPPPLHPAVYQLLTIQLLLPSPGLKKEVWRRGGKSGAPHQAADWAVRFMAGLAQFDRLHRKALLLAVRISSGGLHEAAAHTRWPWGSNGVKRTPSRAHKWYFIQPKDKLTGLENIFF